MKRPVSEQTDDAAIIVVVLPGPIRVEKPQPYDRVPEPLFEIHDLNFIHPFGDGVVVMLDDRVVQRNVFGENALVFIAIYF